MNSEIKRGGFVLIFVCAKKWDHTSQMWGCCPSCGLFPAGREASLGSGAALPFPVWWSVYACLSRAEAHIGPQWSLSHEPDQQQSQGHSTCAPSALGWGLLFLESLGKEQISRCHVRRMTPRRFSLSFLSFHGQSSVGVFLCPHSLPLQETGQHTPSGSFSGLLSLHCVASSACSDLSGSRRASILVTPIKFPYTSLLLKSLWSPQLVWQSPPKWLLWYCMEGAVEAVGMNGPCSLWWRMDGFVDSRLWLWSNE